jgi:hypothetical protein
MDVPDGRDRETSSGSLQPSIATRNEGASNVKKPSKFVRRLGGRRKVWRASHHNPVIESPRVTYLGLGQLQMPWLGRGELTVTALREFQPEKLGLPSYLAGYSIEELRVGEQRLTKPGTQLPIELFSELSTFPQIVWPRLGPDRPVVFTLHAPACPPRREGFWRKSFGMPYSWKVIEPPAAPPAFTGAFYGTSVPRMVNR